MCKQFVKTLQQNGTTLRQINLLAISRRGIHSEKRLHQPVLLDETIKGLQSSCGGIFIDATFGAGGHTQAILESSPISRVIAIDQDPNLPVSCAQSLKLKYKDRFDFIQGRFGSLVRLLTKHGLTPGTVKGILFDLGFSSMQVDNPERGFSLTSDGPLDLRMNSMSDSTAADFVANLSMGQLTEAIHKEGGESLYKARNIAWAICEARTIQPITRTTQLAEIVGDTLQAKDIINRNLRKKSGMVVVHPATKTFQALRILVNQEVSELQKGLNGALSLLAPEGRMAVISFHPGEDTIVKDFIRQHT
eukprot:Ihof_evm28s2 gene=Ihof_evmTU28s2